MTERECGKCGRKCFTDANEPCVESGCTGTMCIVITPLPGKRVSGVLVRDKTDVGYYEIWVVLGVSLTDVTLVPSGLWKWPFTKITYHQWTKEEWKEQYGKLPRKGSKCMVIIELISNGK